MWGCSFWMSLSSVLTTFFHLVCFESHDLKTLLSKAFWVRVCCSASRLPWQCCAQFQWHDTGAQCYAKGWRYSPSGKFSPNRKCFIDMNIKIILKGRWIALKKKDFRTKQPPDLFSRIWVSVHFIIETVVYHLELVIRDCFIIPPWTPLELRAEPRTLGFLGKLSTI